MPYDSHITCGVDIPSEDTSGKIANNEGLQRSVGEASSENVDVTTTPVGEELSLISTEKRRAIGKAAIFGVYINYVSAANEKGELFPESWATGQ